MTFTSCCSISCPNDREKLDRLWGKLSSSGRQKQFQTYPNSDSRLPSSAAHSPSTTSSSASAARTQYVRFHHRTTCDYATHRSHPAPIASPAPQRADSLSTDTTLSPTPSAKVLSSAGTFPRFAFRPRLFRSISLADFRSDRPRTDAVRIFRPTWNRSLRPAPLHAATAPNPSKTPTVSLSSAKE